MNHKVSPYIIISFIAVCCLYFFNLQLDFYINDPGLYASLSKHMVQTNDFLSLIVNQKDWLDKPHFPFWIAAISFKIFGVSSFSYNLPIILAIGLSFIYTFKFTTKHYNRTIAWISVFILSTAQYTFMSSTEGRVEPYLMLAIIGSIYHFDRVVDHKRIIDIVLGSALVAIAIMTKGIFIIVPIFGAIGGHLLYTNRNVSFIFKWYWLLIIALICIFILPEIIALYYQFDSKPDKIVFGRSDVSGIKWFLWDSQFSRFINSGPITRSDGNYLYFLHTLLWAFFPWSLVLYYGFFKIIRKFFTGRDSGELYTFSGGMVMLLLFSISKFQLPHYITIVFPFFSIIVASAIFEMTNKRDEKIFISVQLAQICVAIGVMIVLIYFRDWSIPGHILFITVFAGAFVLVFSRPVNFRTKIFLASGLTALFFNFYLSIAIYPTVSNYRGDIKAAKYINKHFENQSVIILGDISSRFEFYCNIPVVQYKNPGPIEFQNIEQPVLLLYTNVEVPDPVDVDYAVIKTFDNYNGDAVTLSFLNPKTRSKKLDKYTLLSIKPAKEETH